MCSPLSMFYSNFSTMATQKPVEWVSALIIRFEEQVTVVGWSRGSSLGVQNGRVVFCFDRMNGLGGGDEGGGTY